MAALLLSVAARADTPAACDLKLNIIDQDPVGLNVRSLPGMDGAVVTAIVAKGAWVRVHVTADGGGWARIDDAVHIDDTTGEERPVFHGSGWVAFSKLGIQEINPGGVIQSAPQNDAPVILRVSSTDEAHIAKATVLGCNDNWLRVRIAGVVGWTRAYCTNWLTTCV
jgi:SH3-like domain-containing protein